MSYRSTITCCSLFLISALVVYSPIIEALTSVPYHNHSQKPLGQHSVQRQGTELRGIRGFRGWFEETFPDAVTTLQHPPKRSSSTKGRRKSASGDSNHLDSDTFEHVLIDINQLLHIALRRSRNNSHALTLLIQELDKCTDIAQPTKSIVLAFDGPPAAAKLATQRRRRYGTVVRGERKKIRLQRLKDRGVSIPVESSGKKKGKNRASREEKELATLAITPGTEFMDAAREAVLYWAWQRMSNPRHPISRCRIYISPSSVPGEGEVKLLDWLVQAGNDIERRGQGSSVNGSKASFKRVVQPHDSVAFIGGDSDLVLEGLIISPSITHNVFVILPDGNRVSYAVSLWETTRTLERFLQPYLHISDIMRVRTDLVLLLIMNGNDYLPKLRGSSGFNKLFHTYLRLLRQWLKDGYPLHKGHDSYVNDVPRPFLIDPDSLEFNLPFCIAFFEELAKSAPDNLAEPGDIRPIQQSITPLSYLYSMVDSGFLPKPAKFVRVPGARREGRSKKNGMIDDDGFNQMEVFKLVLGDIKGGRSDATQVYEFETLHRMGKPYKQSKQLLANMALQKIMGEDYMDYIPGAPDELDGEIMENDDMDDNPHYDIRLGYSWELDIPATSSVDEYLKGLIWNLATYQDGVCSDYGYNYGRRMSPTASQIVAYLKEALEKSNTIGRKELLGDKFVKPLSAGLSCLCALPAQAQDLIPLPFRYLSIDNSVEDIYGRCMDKEANVFDIDLFHDLCTEKMQSLEEDKDSNDDKKVESRKEGAQKEIRRAGRQIITGETFWTVLRKSSTAIRHPFRPPPPFSDRLSRLRQNNRIQVSHIIAADRPRWIPRRQPLSKRRGDSFKQSEMGRLIIDNAGTTIPLEDIKYRKAYVSSLQMPKKLRRNMKTNTEDISPPSYPLVHTNIEDLNAVQCLQILQDAKILSSIQWRKRSESTTKLTLSGLPTWNVKTRQNDTIAFEQETNSHLSNRKIVKQYLASLALRRIFESSNVDWTVMTTKEMKSHFSPSISPVLEEE